MQFQEILHGRILVLRCLDSEIEIRTVEARREYRRLPQHQDVADIVPYLFRRRRRKRADDRTNVQPVDELHNLQIAGSEILPPLGHTVGLIHRYHGNLRIQCKIQKFFRHQALRCNIDNRVTPFPCIGQCAVILGSRQGTV